MRRDPANSQLAAPWAAGLFGLVLALLVVGSPTGGGLLANLDLLAVGDLDIDESIVALGPDLPRRAPIAVLWALLSPPLSAATATRLWMMAIVVVAATGTIRHLRHIATPLRYAGSAVFALSPFIMTRLAVGHLGFVSAVVLLPWTIDRLLAPTEDARRTFHVLLAFAVCGYSSVLITIPALAVGVARRAQLPRLDQVFWGLCTQIVWLAPALAAIGSAGGADSASAFPSDVDDLAGMLRLPVGFGFWRPSNQLGAENAAAALAGVLLVLLSAAAVRWSRYRHRVDVAILGVAGLGVTVASRVPGLRGIYDDLTGVTFLAPLREGQRLLAFTVFAAATLGARGLDAVLFGRSFRVLATAGVALASVSLVGLPAFLGLGGASRGHDTPATWEEAATVVEAGGGPVLALPFTRYFDLDAAGGRRAHHPLPILIDGDVIYSHDLGLGASDVGRDDREIAAGTLVRSLRLGQPLGAGVDAIGLRWIVALPDGNGRDDIDRLRAAGYRTVIDSDEITVFEIAHGGSVARPSSWSAVATAVVAADALWVILAVGSLGATSSLRHRVESFQLRG